MRGLWRFRRRNTELDDLILAYVEGRTDAAEEARLQERFADEPEKRDDVDSLRATVALLHSVAPAKAPRSFALQESPAPLPRPFIRHQWAPAMASAVAAAIVGLLVLGDVTGALTQTGAPPARLEPVATVVVEAPVLSGAQEIQVETVVEKEAELPAAEAPVMMQAVEAAPVEAAAAPEEAPAAPREAAPVEEADLSARGKGAAPPAEAFRAQTPDEAEAAVEEAAEVPEVLAAPSPPLPGAAAPRETVGGGPIPEPAAEDGFSLPVRELEIAFGAAAVLLAAGAWLLLRRRGRRS